MKLIIFDKNIEKKNKDYIYAESTRKNRTK
jgi:hypothetical protein